MRASATTQGLRWWRPWVAGLGMLLLGTGGCTGSYTRLDSGHREAPDRAPAEARHFHDHGTGALTETKFQPRSTFGLDVDDASFRQARAMLAGGSLPERHGVRVADFVNRVTYPYPQPAEGPVAVQVDGARTPFAAGAHLVRIGVSTGALADRAASHVVFAVDVSGSMRAEGRNLLAARLVADAMDRLPASTGISLVTFAETPNLAVRAATPGERPALLATLRGTRSFGRADVLAGLEAAFAAGGAGPDGPRGRRVILISDGLAGWGTWNTAQLEARIVTERERGVRLQVVGLGLATYGDAHLERLARLGGGRYTSVPPGDEEAALAVVERLGTRPVVAENARIQVTFDKQVVHSWRLLGYEDRPVAGRPLSSPVRAGADLAAGDQVTALYEVHLERHARGALGAWRLRWRDPDALVERELLGGLPDTAALERPLEAASPDLRLAACVAETAELLRGSVHARDGTYDAVLGELARLNDLRTPGAREARDVTRLAFHATDRRTR